MKKGLAPLEPDGEPINLHHMTQQNGGSLAEVAQTFHQNHHSALHINTREIPSGIDRPASDVLRRRYWTARADDFGGVMTVPLPTYNWRREPRGLPVGPRPHRGSRRGGGLRRGASGEDGRTSRGDARAGVPAELSRLRHRPSSSPAPSPTAPTTSPTPATPPTRTSPPPTKSATPA
jgi:A nuclease of the HNH/ENDO VII superfamily with conserved LHH